MQLSVLHLNKIIIIIFFVGICFGWKTITLTVYRNGKSISVPGLNDKMMDLLSNARKTVQHMLKDDKLESFYTLTGKPITTSDELKAEKEVVITRKGDIFFWQPKQPQIDQVGIDVTIDGRLMNVKTGIVEPRVFTISNFASYEECDNIVRRFKEESGSMINSSFVLVGAEKLNWMETDPVLMNLTQRASKLMNLPSNLKTFAQIVHYTTEYNTFHVHYDYAVYEDKTKPQRLVTLLLYLNDVEEGGHTVWPTTDSQYVEDKHRTYDDGAALCNNPKMKKFDPIKGSAIMFYNMKEIGHMEGEVDPLTLHSGCPVKKGEKFAINFWYYNSGEGGKDFEYY